MYYQDERKMDGYDGCRNPSWTAVRKKDVTVADLAAQESFVFLNPKRLSWLDQT